MKIVDSLKGDDRSTDEEHFQLLLVQTEVERAKYILTSYVRVRLHKVEYICSFLKINYTNKRIRLNSMLNMLLIIHQCIQIYQASNYLMLESQ